MNAWVIRGLGMAVLHGVALTLLAKYAVYHPTDQALAISVALAVLVGAAALWSALDAWRGVPDRGRAWFIAALVAGVVSGLLYVLGRALFVDQTGVSELGGALTGGAAFSALLVLIPAGLGLFVGGRIGRSQPSDEEEHPVPSPRPRVRPAGESPRRRAQPSGEAPLDPAHRGVLPLGEQPREALSPRPRRRLGARGEEPRG